MKIVAIIQARMGSTRLPGKMMLKILEKPIIQYVFDRVKLSQLINEIWLATTVNSEDDVLAEWAASNGEKFYRGSSDDVLDRYYQTAKLACADVVVRITGDCPLTDGEVIDGVVGEYLKGGCDYVCNTQPPTYPDGLDTEVFAFSVLEKAWKEAELNSEREHVTPYIWKHPEIFKIKNVTYGLNLNNLRWTLDTMEDFEFIKLVIQEAARLDDFSIKTILKIVSDHPEWQEINSKFKRNEGYAKSLREEQRV